MRFRKIAAAVGLLGAVNASAQTARPRVFTPGDMAPEAPSVDVWLDQGSYGYGQPIRPSFASDPGAYVTIVRVTTDGEMRVMYPRRPDLQERYSPGRTVDTRISYAGSPTFNVYESRGTGFVFAIASYDAFDYSYFRIGSEWRTARLASSGRYGDPFEIIRMFIEQTLSE
ncbi:MAG TPA: hypothetical protein VHM24_12160, partial [Gemmatimonadaceae bacterium]|nr:hypothetical protein [Gemmatimonadaceae bacterium]